LAIGAQAARTRPEGDSLQNEVGSDCGEDATGETAYKAPSASKALFRAARAWASSLDCSDAAASSGVLHFLMAAISGDGGSARSGFSPPSVLQNIFEMFCHFSPGTNAKHRFRSKIFFEICGKLPGRKDFRRTRLDAHTRKILQPLIEWVKAAAYNVQNPGRKENEMKLATETSVHPGETAWKAIHGGYDLQVHVAPDVIARRIDDLDLAKEFLSVGLKGFVLKSHYFPTAERAAVVTKAVPGIKAFGAIVLNHSIGGINPVAVELAGRSGCRVVWMPTVDAANETAGRPGGTNKKLPFWAQIQLELAATGINPPPMTVIDEEGNLTSKTRSCLDLIKKHDMILATGHLGRREIVALVRTAKEIGLRKVVVTHAEFPSQSLSAEEQAELADMGALIEHCFTTMHTGKASWQDLMDSIRVVGPERCLISTDLGQTINPPVAEGLAMFAQTLLDADFSPEEVSRMAVTNPSSLVE
jgi:Family of unknown function (DUF6282)